MILERLLKLFDPSWVAIFYYELPEKEDIFLYCCLFGSFRLSWPSTALVPLFPFCPFSNYWSLQCLYLLKFDNGGTSKKWFCWAACCNCRQRSTTWKLTFCVLCWYCFLGSCYLRMRFLKIRIYDILWNHTSPKASQVVLHLNHFFIR